MTVRIQRVCSFGVWSIPIHSLGLLWFPVRIEVLLDGLPHFDHDSQEKASVPHVFSPHSVTAILNDDSNMNACRERKRKEGRKKKGRREMV